MEAGAESRVGRVADGSKQDEQAWNDTRQEKLGRPVTRTVSIELAAGLLLTCGAAKRASGFDNNTPIAMSAYIMEHPVRRART
jgi:hypothetical protein